MLSDEEKKAIEYLKIEYEKLMKEDNILFPLYKSNAKRLIDIIEKQSKEIEELKDDRKKYAEEYIHNNPWLYKQLNENYILKTVAEQKEKEANNEGYFQGRRDERDETDDKIKAKIEELQEDIKYSANPLSIDNSKFGIKVLQSLLEKE